MSFAAGDPGRVLAAMARLAGAGDGWVNVLPRIEEGDEDRPTSLRFMTLFSGGGMGVTMATWIPRGRDGGKEHPSLGITHQTGRRAVGELAARGVALPATWQVEQDHPRRGLVVRLPDDEPDEVVLAWALDALGALAAPAAIRGWRADVHAPVSG